MNKDFQKIIILGIVSIIISALTLYSFKDIKFKNTKKIVEENIKKEQLIQEYEDLINDPNDIFTISYNTELNTTGELNLIMPDFLYNEGFESIATNLKQKDIKLNIIHEVDISIYKQKILSGLNEADIYLLPSTRLLGLALESINIGDNPKVFFNSVFNELITINDNKFIPYSIDPIIIIKKQNIDIGENRKNIFNYTTLRTKGRANSMPIIRGIGENDIKLLENGRESFEHYFDILYLHLKQIKENNDTSELKNMIDTEKINLEYQYTFVKFKQLYENIGKKNSFCKNYPATCLISYNFGDIKFGYLSDLDILEKYFSESKTSFEIINFSNTTNSYPVKGRIFVVSKGNENINIANEFFKEYIKEGISGNTKLWNNTLSAINDIYNTQKEEFKYSKIIQNESIFELIYENINLQEEFLKDKKTLDLLKGKYNPDIYMQQ